MKSAVEEKSGKEKKKSVELEEGMGALPHEGGVDFRVWAPHADEVSVFGDFNGWAEPGVELEGDEHGNWSGRVAEAKVGDGYKYHLKNWEDEFSRIDPRAKVVDLSEGHGKVYADDFDWEGVEFVTPPINELVIYELHVGTFHGDREKGDGTFEGVVRRLKYLRELGINAIELLPVAQFPGESSWGYNPSHPFAVALSYGGADGLKKLVREAHKEGIAVILDIVFNHFGPDALDLWCFDGWSENGGGGIYFYNDWRAKTLWGDTRPDYGRDEVRRYLHDNAMMWIKEFRIDGLRVDGVSFIRRSYGYDSPESTEIPEGWEIMQWINRDLKAHSERALAFAEDVGNTAALCAPVDEGGAGFDAQWDIGFTRGVRAVLEDMNDDERDPGAIASALRGEVFDTAFHRVVFCESHDEVANGRQRISSSIDGGNPDSVWVRRRALQAAGLVCTAPGIPMIFQGQEFLEDGWFEDTEPLDWAKRQHNVGIHLAFRDLIRLRRNWEDRTKGLTGGNLDIFHLNRGAKVIAYNRWYDGGPRDSTVVIVNLTRNLYEHYELRFPEEGNWMVRFNADWTGYAEEFDDAEVLETEATRMSPGPEIYTGSLTLPPYAFLILSKD